MTRPLTRGALIYLNDQTKYTLPLGPGLFQGRHDVATSPLPRSP